MSPPHDTGLIQKLNLTDLFRAGLQDLLAVPLKYLRTFWRDKLPQWAMDHIFSVQAEQRAGSQVRLYNLALQIQCEVAEWGEVEEFRIAIARFFEFNLSPSELVILHFQFDLMDL
jgi:hypothetical protein